jgi:hypothetical protein
MSFLQLRYFNRDIPLTKSERRAVYRDARKLWWNRRRNVGLYTVMLAISMAVPNLLMRVLTSAARLGSVERGILTITLFGVCAVTLLVVLERYCYGPMVRRVMRAHGHDICGKCGYWLRGLGDDVKRCPECGTRREAMPLSPS